jgi:hypothetical protein
MMPKALKQTVATFPKVGLRPAEGIFGGLGVGEAVVTVMLP